MKSCSSPKMLSASAEFLELKSNWEIFISKFRCRAPNVYAAKRNVFFHLVSSDKTEESMVEMARGTRPFLSKQIYELLDTFMESLRKLPGIEGENYKKVYEGMTPAGLIKRLLTKRPIVFINTADDYVLRCPSNASMKHGKYSNWNNVATTLKEERTGMPFLQEYISYDEMLLSALVGISTPTYFVSNGSLRSPNATPRNPHVDKGILSALVGARLEKPNFMESRFTFPKPEDLSFDKVHHNDLFWIEKVYPEAFPEGKIPTHAEIEENPKVYEGIYKNGVNVVYYEKRVMFSVIPFIMDVCARSKEFEKRIVASICGIGAGVWKGAMSSDNIHEIIVVGILKYLDNNFDSNEFKYLAGLFLPVVDLRCFREFVPKSKISSLKLNEKENLCEISFKECSDYKLTIFNQRRYLADPLSIGFEDCMVMGSYAFDSNSYPGNEYWLDSFTTFDPQAMICSLLGQFQNPEVNTRFVEEDRIRVY